MMALLDWDDFQCSRDALPGEPEPVWHLITIRVLDAPEGTLARRLLGGWQIDPVRAAQIGQPTPCPQCNLVAVLFDGGPEGPVYPAGGNLYGDRDLLSPGVYCPHCDGAEDSP